MFKRGLEHVEVIIGFGLFLTFLVFGLYFFNPLNSDRVLDSTLYYATDEIVKNTTSALETISVTLRDVPQSSISLPVTRHVDGLGVRVEAPDGHTFSSKYASPSLSVNRGSEKFLKVIFGDFVSPSESVSGVQPLLSNQYQLATSDTREVISEQRFLLLNSSYPNQYQEFKKQFNLPGRTDFAFSLVFSDQERIQPSFVLPLDARTFSNTKRVEVVRLDGRADFADLTVITW